MGGGVKNLVGAASVKASDFTSAYQTPFGQKLSQIFDPIVAAKNAGTLTFDQANQALTDFNQQWTAFDAAAQQWKSKGGDYEQVVDQAYDPNQAFMKTVDNVRTSLTDWTTSLKPADSTDPNQPTAPPTLQQMLAALGLTPAGAGDQAADLAAKHAQQGTKTILTGGQGVNVDPMNRSRKTLLGY